MCVVLYVVDKEVRVLPSNEIAGTFGQASLLHFFYGRQVYLVTDIFQQSCRVFHYICITTSTQTPVLS